MDGAPLSLWADQSPIGNDASQGVPANQPVFRDNAADRINFNSTVSFARSPQH